MVSKAFKRIALMSRKYDKEVYNTLLSLIKYLIKHVDSLVLEEHTAFFMQEHNLLYVSEQDLAKQADLLIVVGGDGSLLKAANIAVNQNIPVLGINRGRLGFLADVYPENLEKIQEIIAGYYQEEFRFLLQGIITQPDGTTFQELALNDIVLLHNEVVSLIEFDIEIDQEFFCGQRADGLIISTPTGSTAYSLSAGGPILPPNLDAIALVPMFPHTLSSRPVVVAGSSKILVRLPTNKESQAGVSFDGQKLLPVSPGGTLQVNKFLPFLRLIHPQDYNYFATLQTKLNWERRHYVNPSTN